MVSQTFFDRKHDALTFGVPETRVKLENVGVIRSVPNDSVQVQDSLIVNIRSFHRVDARDQNSSLHILQNRGVHCTYRGKAAHPSSIRTGISIIGRLVVME